MLTQKLILSYGSKTLIQFIQIAASIVVARVAGPTVLGTVAFGLAFVSMFEFIADLGIGTAHVKLVSEGQDIGKCISTYSVLKMINVFLFSIIVLSIFLTQKYILHIRYESTAHEYVIIIIILTATVNQLLFIPQMTFVAKTEQAKQDIPNLVRSFIYQILRVIVVLLGYKAVALALGNLVSSILVIPFVLYLFKDYPRAKFDRKMAAKYLKISLPILVIGLCTKIVHYLDTVLLQYFTNSEHVGYYSAGYRIGGLVIMIANSVGLLFFPLFSKAISNGDLQYVKNKIEKFERFSFQFIMPVVIFLSLYSDVIIKVALGNQYLASIPVMIIINIAMFLMVLNVPYGNVIAGMGFFKLAAILNVFNLFLFSGLLTILSSPRIFNLGPTGAAIAVFVSNVFIGLLYRVFAKQKCSCLDISNNIKFAIFGIINFSSIYFLYKYLSQIYGANFKIAFIFLYFVITYLALFLLRLIKKTDLHNLMEIINIKKISSYIQGEIKGR